MFEPVCWGILKWEVLIRKLLLLLSGLVVLVCGLAVALFFANNAYHAREMQRHREVLQKLLAEQPTVARLEAQVDWEFYRAAQPAHAKELSTFWDNRLNSPEEVEQKVSKWPQTRIYFHSPMVYFIYFDSQGVMRDFSVLSN